MMKQKLVSIVMGSQSDWKTLINCEIIFKELKIPFEKKLFLHIELQKDFINTQKSYQKIKLKL